MKTILIADDDKLSRRILQTTLEKAGYRVIAVDDGVTAGRFLCQQDGPRLALLDWMMPGMDGLEVIRAVRQQTGMPYVHMILRTSRQSKEDIIAGLESGADDYLTKPYDAVSRYGGEEFLVVLNGCRTTQGANRAEHMRHAIYDHAVETASQAVAISMSFGVAGTEDWQELNAEQLIHEADVALYRAKSLGRNRTVLARPSGLQEIREIIETQEPVSAD